MTEKQNCIGKILWYPVKNKLLREYMLSMLIGLERDDKIWLWVDWIDNQWLYVITPLFELCGMHEIVKKDMFK